MAGGSSGAASMGHLHGVPTKFSISVLFFSEPACKGRKVSLLRSTAGMSLSPIDVGGAAVVTTVTGNTKICHAICCRRAPQSNAPQSISFPPPLVPPPLRALACGFPLPWPVLPPFFVFFFLLPEGITGLLATIRLQRRFTRVLLAYSHLEPRCRGAVCPCFTYLLLPDVFLSLRSVLLVRTWTYLLFYPARASLSLSLSPALAVSRWR